MDNGLVKTSAGRRKGVTQLWGINRCRRRETDPLRFGLTKINSTNWKPM